MHKYHNSIKFSLEMVPAVLILILASLSVIFFLLQSGYEDSPCNLCRHNAYAQSVGNSNSMIANNVTQMWTDRSSGISINLAYSPSKPVVDSPTDLRFIVRNLTGDNNLKDVTAHVSITSNSSGQERTFKYNNITAPNGAFSLKYIFPDYGTYQILAAVKSNTSAVALASFPINIPVQVASAFFSPTLIIGIVIIIVGVAALVVVVMKIKK